MGIVAKTKALGDLFEIVPLLNQAPGGDSPVIPEEVFWPNTQTALQGPLELPNRQAEKACDFRNGISLIFSELDYVPPGLVKNPFALPG